MAACSSNDGPPGDAGSDAFDAGTDAVVGGDTGVDSAMAEDAGVDAFDAGFDAGPLTGESYVYVFDLLDVGAADPAGDPNIVPGFDLDGVTSDGTEVETCRTPDFTSPAPDSEEGVDNAIGPLLADQEEDFRIRASTAASVRSGRLLILLEVRGVDDFENDDRVEVDVLFGLLPAGLEAPIFSGERFLAAQTFNIDARSLEDDMMTARVSLPGEINDGRLRAGPGRLALTVPLGDEVLMLDLERVELRADITEDNLELGVLGGALDVAATAEALAGVSGFEQPLVMLVLNGAADLDRVGANCTAASIGLVFRGVDAVKGDVVMPDPPPPMP
ncbi:MAG: hypothetical protein AAGE52_03540 [Myxococcota bacterium]